MVFTDIFNTSFLFSISLILVSVSCLFVYFNYKLSAQDQKLNSMIDVVSTMAEESQFFRHKLNTLQQSQSPTSVFPGLLPTDNLQFSSQLMGGDLINVSETIKNNPTISV